MKKIILISLLLLAVFIFGYAFFYYKKKSPVVPAEQNQISNDAINKAPIIKSTSAPEPNFSAPLDKVKDRVTKKYFGLKITPQFSPVQPERFSGYHTGTDFEIFPEELNSDVTVRAVCNGKLLQKTSAGGYGGVAVQSCVLDNQPITVIYGHLKLSSVLTVIGQEINRGNALGILGATYSTETDRERKHLHLGFHKGAGINILGYVSSQNQLSNWIDPCLYVCQ